MKDIVVKRLKPNQDFKAQLEQIAKDKNISAGVIVCAVGSLIQASLRMAGSSNIKQIQGPLEIVSCIGTLGTDGLHVHLSVADAHGDTTGGHLVAGCLIHTTIELVILNLSSTNKFLRQIDTETGFRELVVGDD